MKRSEFKEIKKNIGQDEDISVFNVSGDSKPLIVPLHWHESMEIVCANVSGQVFVEGVAVNYNQGDIVILMPNVLHSYSSNFCGNYTVMMINGCSLQFSLPTPAAKKLNTLLSGGYYDYLLLQPNDRRFTEILSLITVLSNNKKDACPIRRRGEILCLLSCLIDGVTEAITAPSKGFEVFKKVIAYIEADYQNSITVLSLCKQFYISKSSLMLLFSKFSQSSFIEFLLSLRLDKSLKFLRADDPVAVVAMRCGFHNVSYYIRRFKDKYGITPLQYKKII